MGSHSVMTKPSTDTSSVAVKRVRADLNMSPWWATHAFRAPPNSLVNADGVLAAGVALGGVSRLPARAAAGPAWRLWRP